MRRWMMMQLINADFLVMVKNVLEKSNMYIAANVGQEAPYNGWGISKYHEIQPNCKRLLLGKDVIRYGAFYDADKQLISTIDQNKTKVYEEVPILQVVEIPEQAKYFRDSDTLSTIGNKIFMLST